MEVGDLVLLTNNKTNKQSPNYNTSPCEVIDRYRGEVSIRKKDGVETKRNNYVIVFLKKYQENGTSESESESVAPLQPIASPISVQQTVNPPLLKTSLRPTQTTCIGLPKRFGDYELSRA